MSGQEKIEMMRQVIDEGRFFWNNKPISCDYFLTDTKDYREGFSVIYEGDVDVDENIGLYRTVQHVFRFVAVLSAKPDVLRKGGLRDVPSRIKEFMDLADRLVVHLYQYRDPVTAVGLGMIESSVESLGTVTNEEEEFFSYGQRFRVSN